MDSVFWKKMRRVLPQLPKRDHGGVKLPSLRDCRESFTAYLGETTWTWQGDTAEELDEAAKRREANDRAVGRVRMLETATDFAS